MGARWNWEAICEKGHLYGNFSGGADDCYECGAPCLVEYDGDDAMAQLNAHLGTADARALAPGAVLAQLSHVQGIEQARRERNGRAIREYDHLRSFHKCEDHPTDAVCFALLDQHTGGQE